MKSFRAQFAPIINQVIESNENASIVELKALLRKKWSKQVKTPANQYMVSTWSKEVKEQLLKHPGNQRPLKELPLFLEMG